MRRNVFGALTANSEERLAGLKPGNYIADVAPERLGQHFLADDGWRERIARAVLGMEDGRGERDGVWVEIGAGHGEMTELLAPRARHVSAIELDPKLLPRLRETMAPLDNVRVVAGDVLALNLAELAEGERFRVYGNLPYYITSPIVHRLFEYSGLIEAFIVIQLEVAERLTAKPGSRDYGYLSAFTQFHSRPEIVFRLPSGAFRPPPKVASALVALRLPGEGAKLGVSDASAFADFLKGCFAQKRKMLRNNLRALMDDTQAQRVLQAAGIRGEARAETLTLTEFARLFSAAQEAALR